MVKRKITKEEQVMLVHKAVQEEKKKIKEEKMKVYPMEEVLKECGLE